VGYYGQYFSSHRSRLDGAQWGNLGGHVSFYW
jgi:hypothetical protein